MENICREELQYLNEEIRNRNGKAFDISVKNFYKCPLCKSYFSLIYPFTSYSTEFLSKNGLRNSRNCRGYYKFKYIIKKNF